MGATTTIKLAEPATSTNAVGESALTLPFPVLLRVPRLAEQREQPPFVFPRLERSNHIGKVLAGVVVVLAVALLLRWRGWIVTPARSAARAPAVTAPAPPRTTVPSPQIRIASPTLPPARPEPIVSRPQHQPSVRPGPVHVRPTVTAPPSPPPHSIIVSVESGD
jgi:hypothetical protein